MDEKRIEEIMKDPNTWEWDGCTYPETDIDSSYLDNIVEENLKRAKKLLPA